MTAREIAEKLCRITDTSFKHIPTITQALEEREREGYLRGISDAAIRVTKVRRNEPCCRALMASMSMEIRALAQSEKGNE